MNHSIPLTFRTGQIWLTILGLLLGCILVFQYMTLQRADGHLVIEAFKRGDVAGYLKNWLYYFPFECLSISVLIGILSAYKHCFKLQQLTLTPLNLLTYQLLYLPPVLLAIPIFCPITNGMRYIFYGPGDYLWANYFPEYFFTWRMCLNYVLPVLIFGYGYININFILDYVSWYQQHFAEAYPPTTQFPSSSPSLPAHTIQLQVETKSPTTTLLTNPTFLANRVMSDLYPTSGEGGSLGTTPPARQSTFQTIDALDADGRVCLPVKTVYYFTVDGKSYIAQTASGTYSIRKTIAELEKGLDPIRFYRINRGVIINVQFMKNYSHWEYDKYIVRLMDGKTEFVMQRNRLKGLQECLAQQVH